MRRWFTTSWFARPMVAIALGSSTIERVFFALLQFVLGRRQSFAALVSALRAGTVGGLGPIAVSDRAFTLRLESLPHASFLAVLLALTARLRTLAVPGREWVRVEHYRRNDDATWTLTIVPAGVAVRLPDLGGDLLAEEVYRDVFAP